MLKVTIMIRIGKKDAVILNKYIFQNHVAIA